MRSAPLVEVLHEDNHCLAVNKPAGLLTQGDDSGDPTLLDWAADYLKRVYQKPGRVFVGLVHRLDRPVSGVVLLARTSKGAGRLARQFREGNVLKVYWALVEGTCLDDDGEWSDRLLKAPDVNRSWTAADDVTGKAAEVGFRVLARPPGRTLLELRPRTGRGHQLRVQLASRGLPIVGDRKYGARGQLRALDGGHRIALHARSLEFQHPTREATIAVTAPVPADWPALASPG